MRFLIVILVAGNIVFFVGSQWFWEQPQRIEYRLPQADITAEENTQSIILVKEQYSESLAEPGRQLDLQSTPQPAVLLPADAGGTAADAEVEDSPQLDWPQNEAPRLFTQHETNDADATACRMLGPVAKEQVSDLLEYLISRGVEARADDILVVGIAGYSVILGPYDSSEDALSIHRHLDANSLENFVFSDEDRRNGISLGFFGTRGAAERLAATAAELGYEPGIREREQLSREHWVMIRDIPAEEVLVSLPAGFLMAKSWEGFCRPYVGMAP